MAKRRIKRINKRRRQKIVRHTLPSNSNEMIQNALWALRRSEGPPNAMYQSPWFYKPRAESPGDFLKKSHRSQTSARARILANSITPIITPPMTSNINWDNVNRMRTDNDNKQQQINDVKSAKLDELERKKKLDKEERDIKRLTKEAEDKYKDEKKRAELAEKELKKQRELAAQYKAENDKYSKSIYELQQTINAGEIDDIKNKNATIQAKIAEAKMLNMNRKHELDKNTEYRKSSELEQELKQINIENEALQKTLDSDEFTKSNQKLMENQRRIDLARYRNELLKKQRDLQFENERNRINSLTQLTEADYKNIENEHRDKIKTAYQQQIAENAKMRANKRYIDRNEHLAEIEKQTTNELIDTEIENNKLTEYQLANGPNNEINDKIKENIKKNAQTKSKNKDLELINKQQNEYENKQRELETTQAELDYLNSQEHKKQIDVITDLKKNTLINQKNIDAMKAIETANQHKIKTDVERTIQQDILQNRNTAYDLAAAAKQIANKTVDQAYSQHEEKIQLNTELYNLRSTYGDDVFAQFLNNYPVYQKIVERFNNNVSLELIDLTTFRNLVKSFREYMSKA